MRRWIAVAVLTALPGAALLSTASCGSQAGSEAGRGDASNGQTGQGDGAGGGGDSTTGGYTSDDSSPGSGDDGSPVQGDDSSPGADSAGDDGGDLDAAAADGGGGGGDGNDGACVPATGCPSTYHCGRYVDPCTGAAFDCGSACTGGQVCAGTDAGTVACQAKTCGTSCGIIAIDGCGVPISCGGCAGGKVCINNACVTQPPEDAATGYCNPLTCTPTGSTHLCGAVGDVCGNSMTCTCPSGEQCIDGVCSPPPPECGNADAGYKCGTVANACGSGNVTCSSCPTGTRCAAGVCESCPAPSCGTAACGTASNACGTTINCGTTCPTGQVCNAGACCTPSTCAEVIAEGGVTGCGAVSLGCNVTKSCEVCDGGEVCTANACVACVPKTCASYGDAGCGHAIGCGMSGTLNCCAAGTTCMGTLCCPSGEQNANGICCPAGEVNFGGACCKPTCDPHKAGAQESCGVTLYCAG
jgi:hypothetical protein